MGTRREGTQRKLNLGSHSSVVSSGSNVSFTPTGNVTTSVWTPLNLGNKVKAWYDYTSANASPIDTLSSLVGSLSLTSSGINRPTISGTTIVYDGTNDQMVGAAAADWKFLHDGTGMVMAFVVEPTTLVTPQMLAASCSQANSGFVLETQVTASKTRHFFQVFSGGSTIININDPVGFTNGGPHIVTINYTELATPKEATLRIDGVEVANADSSGAPNSGNPEVALRLGGYVGSPTTWPLSDIVYEVIACITLSSTELILLEDYLKTRWGTP